MLVDDYNELLEAFMACLDAELGSIRVPHKKIYSRSTHYCIIKTMDSDGDVRYVLEETRGKTKVFTSKTALSIFSDSNKEES